MRVIYLGNGIWAPIGKTTIIGYQETKTVHPDGSVTVVFYNRVLNKPMESVKKRLRYDRQDIYMGEVY